MVVSYSPETTSSKCWKRAAAVSTLKGRVSHKRGTFRYVLFGWEGVPCRLGLEIKVEESQSP